MTAARSAQPRTGSHAAAVCVRRRRGRVQVLLVDSSGGRPTLPKGRVEAGERPAEAAVREAREEAGVHGVALAHLGGWRHGRRRKHVEAFLVAHERLGRPLERWRNPRWVDVEVAGRLLTARCATVRDRKAVRTALAAAAARAS